MIEYVKQKYRFQFLPEESGKGDGALEFAEGKFQDFGISRFSMYDSALVADSSSPTERVEEFLDFILSDLISTFDLVERQDWSRHYDHLSVVNVRMDLNLSKLRVAQELLTDAFELPMSLESIKWQSVDRPKVGLNKTFLIERLAETTIDDRLFHSVASLPSVEHAQLLARLERVFTD